MVLADISAFWWDIVLEVNSLLGALGLVITGDDMLASMFLFFGSEHDLSALLILCK
jgi:hypothetical protein